MVNIFVWIHPCPIYTEREREREREKREERERERERERGAALQFYTNVSSVILKVISYVNVALSVLCLQHRGHVYHVFQSSSGKLSAPGQSEKDAVFCPRFKPTCYIDFSISMLILYLASWPDRVISVVAQWKLWLGGDGKGKL